MNFNLKDLIEFYDSELGKISVISIQEKLHKFLDTKLKQNVLGFGYILPYLRKKILLQKLIFYQFHQLIIKSNITGMN